MRKIYEGSMLDLVASGHWLGYYLMILAEESVGLSQ